MGKRGVQHLQVNVRTLVSGKSDVAHLPGLFGFEHRFHAPAVRKYSLWIRIANDFMELQQIDVIGLQTLERFLQLLSSHLLSAPVNLSHQERLLPISVAQCLSHPDLALPVVVIPAVVEEVDALIERATNNK